MGQNSHLPASLISPVTDAEIDAAARRFGLYGLDDERRKFLKTLESVDVSACPGSGKTTLILAKLAILTDRWPYANRGVCLLSHTNVAKDEIASRFQKSDANLDITDRPHYIGTIHSFLNQFLVTPYLVSQGIVPKVIDNNIGKSVFLSKVYAHPDSRVLRLLLDRRHKGLGDIKLTNPDLDRPFGESLMGAAGPGTKSYECAADALRECISEGYLRPDDLLVFAERYIEQDPWVKSAVQERFPVVLVDEMQDTTEIQSRIIDLLFPHDSQHVTIQRIGDPNQSIYGQISSGATHIFPRDDALSISNSFRVSKEIARAASPLAIIPVQPNGLEGVDRRSERRNAENYFIVFEGADDISLVLPTFARLVANELDIDKLDNRSVCAVGARHRLPDGEVAPPGHFPKTVGDYYPPYQNCFLLETEFPETLQDAIVAARSRVEATCQVNDGLALLLDAIIRVLMQTEAMSEPLHPSRVSSGLLLHLSQQLDIDEDSLRTHLLTLLDLSAPLNHESVDSMIDLLQGLTSVRDSKIWRNFVAGNLSATVASRSSVDEERTFTSSGIPVRVGSIHSIKGETHAATLILDTYNNARYVEKLMPWLTGKRQNLAKRLPEADRSRLATCYVAMTRPTHLLAIAAPIGSLGKTATARLKNQKALEERGWKLVNVRDEEQALTSIPPVGEGGIGG